MTKRVVTDTDIGGSLEIDGSNLLQNKIATVAEALAGTDTEHSISPSVLFNGAVIEQIQSNAWEQQPDASAAQISALSDNDEVLVKTASGDILQVRLGDLFTLDVSVVEGALTDVIAAGTDIVVNTDLSEASVASPNRTDFVVGSTVGTSNYKVTWDDALIAMAASTTERGSVELATDAETTAKTDTERALTPSNLAALVSSETLSGLVELATDAEAVAGTDTVRAITPANLAAVIQGGGVQTAATVTVHGTVELATSAEVITGTDTTRAVTPSGLAALTATETRDGLVELATSAEVVAGTDATRAVTPDTLNDVLPRSYLTSNPGAIPASPVLGSLLTDDAVSGDVFQRVTDGTNDLWLNISI